MTFNYQGSLSHTKTVFLLHRGVQVFELPLYSVQVFNVPYFDLGAVIRLSDRFSRFWGLSGFRDEVRSDKSSVKFVHVFIEEETFDQKWIFRHLFTCTFQNKGIFTNFFQQKMYSSSIVKKTTATVF